MQATALQCGTLHSTLKPNFSGYSSVAAVVAAAAGTWEALAATATQQ
jgi:hypothetical protein